MQAFALLLIWTAAAFAQVDPEETTATFGTTVVDNSGLQGRVFHLEPGAFKLPKFHKLEPVGVIYTSALNVRRHDFLDGFPGVSDRYEWFAIEYTGRFWIEEPGRYEFALNSDDGSKLFIDGKRVIDNDGRHAVRIESARADLTRGVHDIRVEYFQGPRWDVALILGVRPPGEDAWRLFDMRDFRPPRDETEWQEGEISRVKRTRFRP